MPHVIISGMPGIGKTTSILCLARQMLGDAYKEAVLELNASDERGECSKIASLFTVSCRNISPPRKTRANLVSNQGLTLCAIALKALRKKR